MYFFIRLFLRFYGDAFTIVLADLPKSVLSFAVCMRVMLEKHLAIVLNRANADHADCNRKEHEFQGPN